MAGNRILLSMVVLVALSAGSAYAAKVTVCHLPPGNGDNPQTISVSEESVDPHLAHGDILGECGCQQTEPTEDSCTDGVDNDCDQAVDTADSDCFVCGDGVTQPPEECDDGNTNPFDGCDACILVDITPG